MPTMPEGYYNRYDPAKDYDAHLFRAGCVLQAAELNEIQSFQADRVKRIGDALFKDGAIVRDAQLIVDSATGAAIGESGAIYLKGEVRGIPARNFTVPVIGTVTVGIYLVETVVTALEDPTLRDPAIGVRNYQEPGAARLKAEPRWGYAGEPGAPVAEFYPVYTVQNAVVTAKEPPPQVDATTMALARYDRESSGGYYVVSGMRVAAEADWPSGEQVYSLSAGSARVDGQAVYFPTAIREVYPAVPDLATVDSEPHVSGGIAPQRINLNHTPVSSIPQVRITAVKTVTLTHGAYMGALDALPDTAVLELVSVSQSSTTYVQGTDYKLTSDQVDWSLSGAEPAPGSSYSVTYHYMLTVTPTAIDSTGCTVAGAVTGTLILVTYTWKMPRWDRLCLNALGQRIWLQGVPHAHQAIPPAPSPGLLVLATIKQTWTADRPILRDGIYMVSMGALDSLAQRIDDLYALTAEQRLLTHAALDEPTSKLGVFVDPFLDDNLRDQGIAQTGAVFGGELTLAFDLGTVASAALPAVRTLPIASTPVVEIDQSTQTGFMAVNPYQAFAPLPARLSLTPTEDYWTETATTWLSAITQQFDGYGTTSTVTNTLSSSQSLIEYLRQRTVNFTLGGFDAGEIITKLTFDGIDVTPSPVLTADSHGAIAGSFVIPALVRAGVKRVQLWGNQGNYAEATFVGQGTLTTQTQQQVTTIYTGYSGGGGVGVQGGGVWQGPWETPPPTEGGGGWGGGVGTGGLHPDDPLPTNPNPWFTCTGFDPLAQTFVLSEAAMVDGVHLWFTAKGTSNVRVEIRETQNGFPTNFAVVGNAIKPADIALTGPTLISWSPVRLEANHEYALVVACDDADTALAIAELGKYDSSTQRWVTSQPYQVGVLLSSSNNSTWTAHQDRDLTFRLLAATFSATTRAIALPDVTVTACNEVMVMARVQRPSAETDVRFELTLPDVAQTKIVVAENQPVILPATVTGVIQWRALLSGSTVFSPRLFPDVELVCGSRLANSTYISRAIPAGVNCTATAYLDVLTPGNSSLIVEAQNGSSWTAMTLTSGTPVGDGWETRKYQLDGFSPADQETRVRLTLSGTSQTRPSARNLRAIITSNPVGPP